MLKEADVEKTRKDKSNGGLIEGTKALPVLTVDYDLYAHFLEESDASEEDKRKLIETLWSITMMFVDMGFGVHPVQQAQKACGQFRNNAPKPALTAPDKVEYPYCKLHEEFEPVAKGGEL